MSGSPLLQKDTYEFTFSKRIKGIFTSFDRYTRRSYFTPIREVPSLIQKLEQLQSGTTTATWWDTFNGITFRHSQWGYDKLVTTFSPAAGKTGGDGAGKTGGDGAGKIGVGGTEHESDLAAIGDRLPLGLQITSRRETEDPAKRIEVFKVTSQDQNRPAGFKHHHHLVHPESLVGNQR